ncbi:LuxR C-terminal-related transcriptional regulator [Solicola gregarius]|uniref:LuxR C-terminal-related transcriptional regulator n=1 Tax=Solicola gregarius TaxID=2908642 RepID=A0AA46TF07_9ACTN|nr:LuxR C-terminal-related transcriptional regulator [Solicola gregarius]UYM03353.1 LuxR C-terminal-related transcriptional regulator [Solicola gregarius]
MGPDQQTGVWRPTDLDLTILRMLSRGHTIEYVARQVALSERTVRRRLRTIADDLGVDSSIEAIVHAVRAGLI